MTWAQTERHSLWLLPEPAALDRFSALIAEFAHPRASPVFVPHVTLIGELRGAMARSLAACTQPARLCPPISARVTAVVATSDSFRSMFLSLHLGEGAGRLRRSISENLGAPAPPDFQPHVSLAYGWAPCPRKSRTMQTLASAFAGHEFRLNAIAVATSSRTIPVADWAIRERIAFSAE